VTPVELHMVSDATGETAQRLVQALEAQFPEQEFLEIRHPRVESISDLQLAVDRMKGRAAVVVYTLVDPELRDAMRTLCRRAKLHYCDLLGHPIEAIAKVSGQAAKMKPGARPPLNDAYFRRMSAIEFAVKFDDGVGAGLREADIVLVGVSRTSKTPLSIYLGYLGYKAANVPLVKGIEPPPELFTIDQSKVVGLTIDAQRCRRFAASGSGGCAATGSTRTPRGDLRRARSTRAAHPSPARVSGDRGERALDRGDLALIIRVVTERREAATTA
jgi:regulator of PEP synthase PpsR (kinase-PPPase family)